MKKLKQFLALFLVLSLVLGVAPLSALATEGTDPTDVPESTLEPTEDPTEAPTEAPTEDPTEVPTETPTEAPTEATAAEPKGAAYSLLSDATTFTTKPADGTTNGQPFSSGTGGSTNFRIPALITLSNGNLLAAADARYTTTADGYGLDTMVSYSTNNGSTWNYSYANYFDDSTGYNTGASAFIDPVLVQGKDGTVYLFADMYPGGGYYIANIKSGTGFTTVDGVSYLALYSSTSATSSTTPAYYVANERNSDGYYTVYNYSSKTASNYALDAEYDIYTVSNGTYTAVTGTQIDSSSTTINANVFYTGTANQSGLYVLGTEYITMRKGTVNSDGSITWGGLQLLNVKNSSESFYGFGPGGGIVTSTGRIIVPLYTYANGADGKTSVIYSDDNGATWTRSADMNVQTSEASISEVTVGGTNYLYMFTRHGGYFLSEDNGATWSNQMSVSGISYTTSCELSTLTYSKLIDGCPAILLSAPTSDRTTGKIFVGLVQTNGSITWKYTYGVNGSGTYQYSDLAELPDGSIGLLYEDGSASITYTNLAISTIASGATIGGSTETTDPTEPVEPSKTKDITIYVGQTYIDTIEGADYSNSIDETKLNESIATVSAEYEQVTGGKAFTAVTSVSTNNTYYIQASDGTYLTSTGTWSANIDDAYAWTLTNAGGGSGSGGSSYRLRYGSGNNYTYLRYNNGWTTTTSQNNATTIYFNNGTFYRTRSGNKDNYTYSDPIGVPGTIDTTASVNATTVTISGVAPGETSVVVGNTTYNITVKEIPPVVDAETTPFTVGTSHTGAGEILTKLTLSVGLTYDIDLASSYSGGTWSIADTNIATVDQDGKVTGVATGETTLTYTASNGVAYTIPVVIVQNTTTSTKICSLHITEIVDTTVWYSWNCSGSEDQFIQAVNGEAIYVSFASNTAYCINFYGAPAEGYALTFMSATNSNGQYLALQNKTDPTQCDFYTQSGAGLNERGYSVFGDAKVAADIQAALNLGCDGAQGFSRGTGDSSIVNCDLTFCSRKLPTVTKEVATVNGVAYTEGMVAHVGEKVVFNITITQYASDEAITYSSVTLKDNLSGATFAGSTSSTKTITDLSNTAVSTDTTHTYQVEYTITNDDLDTTIVNTVDLTYTYQSAFSSGSFGGTANADAKITAVTFDPPDYVIDFGLPVKFDFSGSDAHGRYDLVSAEFVDEHIGGTVSVENNVVTFTPDARFLTCEYAVIRLTNTAGGNFTFRVSPATTVYYEEGFAELTGFTGGSKGTGTQATQIAGGSTDNYGYDAKYAGESNGASNGTQAISTESGDSAVFTFTGTGVEIYANCDPTFYNEDGSVATYGTGVVSVIIRDSNGSIVKFYQVDTAMVNGSTAATEEQNVNAYNVPIVSELNLSHNTYTVTIKHVNRAAGVVGGNVKLDGFRVYGTLATEPDFYVTDKEDNPTFIEVRDQVLAGLSVTSTGSNQTNAALPTDTTVAVVASSEKYTQDNVNDLLNNGPKNEIYLQKDQALVLKITTAREVQIGLKALNAATTYTINKESKSISTSTDMFYTVLNNGTSGEQTITITNTGSGILAVTKLKVCDDPNAALGTLTEEDLTDALVALGILEVEPTEPQGSTEPQEPTEPDVPEQPTEPAEPEQPTEPDMPEVTYDDAALNVSIRDYTGKQLASAYLTANGVTGENHTFSADEILAAVAKQMPKGYALVNESAVTDTAVVYGETGTVTVQIGRTASLKVTYVSARNGKAVGTTTITVVQTSASKWADISASDIRAAAPSGTRAIWLLNAKVPFGMEMGIKVLVY